MRLVWEGLSTCGTVVAQGGRFGGSSIYLLPDGRPAYCYNPFGLERFKAIGEDPLQGGEQQVRVEFDYDGGGVGKGGKATLYVDGDETASTR